jgi:hypothetical protein
MICRKVEPRNLSLNPFNNPPYKNTMNIESQVCSLELAKKLEELKVPQKSLFWWCEHKDGQYYLEYGADCEYGINGHSAFTVAELGEMLPNKKNGIEVKTVKDGGWYCIYEDIEVCVEAYKQYHGKKIHRDEWAHTEADARAKMLIYLLENKLITLPL